MRLSRNHAVKVRQDKRRGAENAEGRRDFFISEQSLYSDVGPSFSPSALLCVLCVSAFVGTVSSAWIRLNHLLLLLMLLAGCATTPQAQIQRKPDSFPTDALITQRGVLTVLGRQFTLNGYLATSATNGQRLVVTENFGNVLADVLVKPDGKAYVMKSSRAFKPKWIERHIAADVRCLFGDASDSDCPVQTIGTNHFLIERRWYKLDLQTVQIKPGVQSAEMFDATKAEK